MRVLIIILFFFVISSCTCQKDITLKATSVSNQEIKEVALLYFWWEIEEINGKLHDKENKAILEDGLYSININNCSVSDDIVLRNGDTNKKGIIKNGKYFNKWIFLFNKDTLKVANYNDKGILNGNYIIYNKNKEIQYKTTFNNGTGYYKNYCFRTEKVKVEGQYLNGLKNGIWIYYDENGNETYREEY